MPDYNISYEGGPESWALSKEYASRLGKVMTSFITTVRTLMVDHRNEAETVSPGGLFLLTQFLRGPTMKAIFYYATLTFHKDRIINTPYLTSPQLIRYFTPGELAAMVANIFCFRRLRRELSEEDWEPLRSSILTEIEIGTHIGSCIPTIGPLYGLLAGSMRHYGQALLCLNNAQKYQIYREHLELRKLAFDQEMEAKLWGCTAQQVAGSLLLQFGLGPVVVNSHTRGLSKSAPSDPAEDRDAYRFAMAYDWLFELVESGQVPDRPHLGEFYPMENDLHKLLYKVNEVRENGSQYAWLDRGKADISPDKTPQLFQEALLENQNPAAMKSFYQENLPEEVLSDMSEDELKEISDISSEDESLE